MTIKTPELNFGFEFDAQAEFESESRGYQGNVIVRFVDGTEYELFFYDVSRLGQDLEEEVKLNHPFIADAGMVVLPKVTLENMKNAVMQMHAEGYFSHLRPKPKKA